MARTRLEVVEDEAPALPAPAALPAPPAPPKRVTVDSLRVLQVLLAVFSERALPFLLAALLFAVTLSIIDQPSPNQLVGLGIYSLFSLAVLVIRRPA